MAAVSAIVLAGGASRRFGGDKLRAPLGGRTVLEHAVRAAAAVSAEVIVVGGHRGAAPELPGLAVTIARDDVPDGGPLVAMRVGLRMASCHRALLVAGDAPCVPPSLLGALAEHHARAAALSADGRAAPLPACVHREAALDAAERLLASGERSLRALLAALGAEILAEAFWLPFDAAGAWRRDVDSVEDLQALRASLAASAGS